MKKAIIITHELERNGAPTMMLHLIDVLIESGYKASVISMEDGPLKEDLFSMNISVNVIEKPLEQYPEIKKILEQYDLVVANTLLTVLFVFMMHNTNVPTLWWIHEPRPYFDMYKKIITGLNGLSTNIRILSVSPSVKELVKEYIGTDSDIVPFAIPEVTITDSSKKEADDIWNSLNGNNSKKTLRLILVGPLSFLKGQDIFVEAMLKLPREKFNDINVIFCCGSDQHDDAVVEEVNLLSKFLSIKVFDSLPHDKLISLISTADFLLVNSRQESMSAVTAEAWMTGTPTILSDACGIGYYTEGAMKDLIYPTCNSSELATLIVKCSKIKASNLYKHLVTLGKNVYHKTFNRDVFKKNIIAEIEKAK